MVPPMKTRLWLSCGALAAFVGVLYACSSDPVVTNTTAETCEGYCSRMATTCSSESDNPFPGTDPKATCLRVCGNWAPGNDKSAGDDLACRARVLSSTIELTGAARTAGCRSAGPITAACGGECETFCRLNRAACTGTSEQYASEAECITQCKSSMPPGLDQPIPKSIDGNTIACRAYHTMVGLGSPTDRTTHCPHAGNPASAHCFGPVPGSSDAGSDATGD